MPLHSIGQQPVLIEDFVVVQAGRCWKVCLVCLGNRLSGGAGVWVLYVEKGLGLPQAVLHIPNPLSHVHCLGGRLGVAGGSRRRSMLSIRSDHGAFLIPSLLVTVMHGDSIDRRGCSSWLASSE